jgi:glycosyltransferase involved in cell wall biosynthesis
MLDACDVLASPHVPLADGSDFFGSPTKLFEYMAMRKPIIASDLEQLHDVLSPALEAGGLPAEDPAESRPELALLTPPGDVDGLMRAIEFVSGRPAWCETLGRNARARVLAQYTWRHHVQAILAGLDRVAGG